MEPISEMEKEIDEFHKRIREFMDSMFQTSLLPLMIPKHFLPATDVFETGEELIIVVDIAGLKREDIQVTLKGNVLRIYGNRSPQLGSCKYHQMEINYGPFERLLRLPVPVDTQDISATYKDGLLQIRLNKKKIKVIKDIEVSE
ncbi:MAG: Hsp20/alpha crystallin family protein [Deltaproteobacteria bacterium]|nr:Hsp20/alpha crystallin family protein [Deltaproteobacteria bacterium]MDL1971962.1 Hsp20/alpha crystallin family protein [Deltaproteobacteria bacterium]